MVDEPIPEPHLRRLAEHVTSDGQLVDVFGKRRQHQPGFLLPFQLQLCNSRVDLSQRFAGFTIPVIIQIGVAIFQKLLSLVKVLLSFIYAKAYSMALFIYIMEKL